MYMYMSEKVMCIMAYLLGGGGGANASLVLPPPPPPLELNPANHYIAT